MNLSAGVAVLEAIAGSIEVVIVGGMEAFQPCVMPFRLDAIDGNKGAFAVFFDQ